MKRKLSKLLFVSSSLFGLCFTETISAAAPINNKIFQQNISAMFGRLKNKPAPVPMRFSSGFQSLFSFGALRNKPVSVTTRPSSGFQSLFSSGALRNKPVSVTTRPSSGFQSLFSSRALQNKPAAVSPVPLSFKLFNFLQNKPQPVPVPAPIPEPVPEEPAPAPIPEPVPEEPAPAPIPEPVPEEPAPVPVPAPIPEPVPEEPVPAPIPEPVPEEPAPAPIPEPVPEEPAPVPAPIPEPVPEEPVPAPIPEPVPEEPAPVPAPIPEPVPEEPVPAPIPEPVPEEPVPAPMPEPVPEEPAPVPAPIPEPVPEEPVPAPMPEPVPEEPVDQPGILAMRAFLAQPLQEIEIGFGNISKTFIETPGYQDISNLYPENQYPKIPRFHAYDRHATQHTYLSFEIPKKTLIQDGLLNRIFGDLPLENINVFFLAQDTFEDNIIFRPHYYIDSDLGAIDTNNQVSVSIFNLGETTGKLRNVEEGAFLRDNISTHAAGGRMVASPDNFPIDEFDQAQGALLASVVIGPNAHGHGMQKGALTFHYLARPDNGLDMGPRNTALQERITRAGTIEESLRALETAQFNDVEAFKGHATRIAQRIIEHRVPEEG